MIKRPMAVIGFSYLAALVAATYFSIEIIRGFYIGALILFLLSLLIKNVRDKVILPLAFLTIAAALLSYISFTYIKIEPINDLDNRDVNISGRVCDLPYENYGRYYYIIETDKIDADEVPQKLKIRMSCSKALDLDVYDRIDCRVHMFRPKDKSGFSPKTYYESKGIYILSYFYEYDNYSIKEEPDKPIYYYFLKLRKAIIEALKTMLPEEQAGVAIGVLLGDKYLISDNIQNNFRDIGIAHILAVSGLHVSFIAAFILLILRNLRIPSNLRYVITCVGIFCFMALTGFSPSVRRAGIMLIILYLGVLINNRADSINSLGIATLIISIINPFSAGDIGFLLSVTSTLGILLFTDKTKNVIKTFTKKINCCNDLINNIFELISMTICAMLTTLPITMLSFGKISLVGVIANLLCVFPTMIMMVFSFISAILYYCGPIAFLAMPFALVAGIIINYLTFCAGVLASFAFASIPTSQGFVSFCLSGAAILIAYSLFLGKKYELVRIASILSFIVLLVGTMSYQIFISDSTELAVLDTGNGCSVFISKGDHAIAVSCGGDKFKFSEIPYYLSSKNIDRLDYMILSDFSNEASYYAQSVIEQYNPYYTVLPNSKNIDDKISRTAADSSNAVYFNENANLEVWGNVKAKAVRMDNQSFIYLTINDVNLLLCPSGGNALYLPSEYRVCDILISGGDFKNYDYINSSYFVLSNNFDNTMELLDSVAKSDKLIIATAGDGNVVFDFKKDKNICIKRVV